MKDESRASVFSSFLLNILRKDKRNKQTNAQQGTDKIFIASFDSLFFSAAIFKFSRCSPNGKTKKNKKKKK